LGIVIADLLDEAAVTRRTGVGDDDVVVGALLGAGAGEAEFESHGFSPSVLSSGYFFFGTKPPPRPGRPGKRDAPPSPGRPGPDLRSWPTSVGSLLGASCLG